MQDIVIFGAGGFAREVFQLIDDINQERLMYKFLGFIDDNSSNKGSNIYQYPILGDATWFENREDTIAIIAVGNPVAKRIISSKLERYNIKSPILRHPDARIGKNVELGAGSIICAGNIITVDIQFGKHTILNLDCTVGHDSVLGDFVTVSPGVHISGNVNIGEGTDLGTGASIVQGINIGHWSIIGAGAVVSKNILPNVTAVGIPARPVKEREEGWHL